MDDLNVVETSVDEPPAKPSLQNEKPETWGWRREHRIGIAIMTVVIIAVAFIWWLNRPALKNDPIVIVDGVKIELPVNIDPNTASAASISRIPGIGEKTAQAIVDYREIHKADFPDKIVFRKLADVVRAGSIRSKKTQEFCKSFMLLPDEPPPSPHGLIPPTKLSDAEQTEEDD